MQRHKNSTAYAIPATLWAAIGVTFGLFAFKVFLAAQALAPLLAVRAIM